MPRTEVVEREAAAQRLERGPISWVELARLAIALVSVISKQIIFGGTPVILNCSVT